MSILLSCHTLSCPDYSLSALFMLSSPELSWLLSIGPFYVVISWAVLITLYRPLYVVKSWAVLITLYRPFLCCHFLSCPDYSLSAPFMLSGPELSWLLPVGPFYVVRSWAVLITPCRPLLCCQVLSCPDYSLSALFMLSGPELSWLLSIGPFYVVRSWAVLIITRCW